MARHVHLSALRHRPDGTRQPCGHQSGARATRRLFGREIREFLAEDFQAGRCPGEPSSGAIPRSRTTRRWSRRCGRAWPSAVRRRTWSTSSALPRAPSLLPAYPVPGPRSNVGRGPARPAPGRGRAPAPGPGECAADDGCRVCWPRRACARRRSICLRISPGSMLYEPHVGPCVVVNRQSPRVPAPLLPTPTNMPTCSSTARAAARSVAPPSGSSCWRSAPTPSPPMYLLPDAGVPPVHGFPG